jgi:lysophospholipase L1-like esterase
MLIYIKGVFSMYLCYGDSITKGSPGISYLRYMSGKRNYMNLGLGGETLIGLGNRVLDSIDKYDTVDYVIQIGTNDILLPFLSAYSAEWRKRVEKIYKRGSIPCESEDRFEEIYIEMIKRFAVTKRRIIVISIPCIGEDIHNELNQRADIYNSIIQKISVEFGVDYLDFNGLQKSLIKNDKNDPYFISQNPNDMIKDVLLSSLKAYRKKISTIRNLYLTVDGCHLNDRGATALAGLLESVIDK